MKKYLIINAGREAENYIEMELNYNEFQILMKFFKKNNEIAKNNRYSPKILVYDDMEINKKVE